MTAINEEKIKELEAKMAAELPKSDAKLEAKIREKQAEHSQLRENAEPWDHSDTAVLQSGIDAGTIWGMEGAAGRRAMSALESGECFLPLNSHKDYYGNRVPPRTALKAGTKGTLLNSAKFWGISVKGKKKT